MNKMTTNMGTLFVVALATLSLQFTAHGQNREETAWSALNAIVPSHSYPARGRMVRKPAVPAEKMIKAIDKRLEKINGTSAEPLALYYKAHALFRQKKFNEAGAQFLALKTSFPRHGLCRSLPGRVSMIDRAISDCASEEEIRKKYVVKDLPHAELDATVTAIFHTTSGDFEMQFYSAVAPKTVAHVVKLMKSGAYNDTYFHRVASFRRIQGGCPNTRDNDRRNDGLGNIGKNIALELSDALHTAGAVSLTPVGGGKSHGCQFNICVHDQPELNNQSAVFARVTKGLEIVRLISQQRADDDGNPYEHVYIRSVEFK